MSQIQICEMSVRDGMQILNRSERIPLEMRLRLVTLLQEAGFPYIEVGSFVRPDRVPAMRDTVKVLQALKPYGGQHVVLVPNERSYLANLEAPNVDTVALFVSASEHYSQKNKRISIADDLADAARVATLALSRGQRVRAHLSGAFRDLTPANQPTPADTVADICAKLIAMGCETVALADTDGRAFPPDIERVLSAVKQRVGLDRIGLHLHDRYGQAIVNAQAAYDMGVRIFDAAVAGIGGNQAVPDTVGNIATEELVHFFQGMGIDTGIKLEPLHQAVELIYDMTRLVGEPLPPSKILREIVPQVAMPAGEEVGAKDELGLWLQSLPEGDFDPARYCDPAIVEEVRLRMCR